MATPQTPSTKSDSSSTTKASAAPAASTSSALVSDKGRTSIADTVVAKIAGIAAREVAGVYELGGGGVRAMGVLRERIPGARTNRSQGVAVEVGERQAALDIDIVAEYGMPIAELAQAIRRNCIEAVQRMTGLEVTEVNVVVHDVHFADEDMVAAAVEPIREPRVQ